jgi:hypothetical protein
MADIEKLDLSMAGKRCDDAGLMCPAWERYFKLEWDYRLREDRERNKIHAR